MDIVQYLHGLIAPDLGVGETDARADLLQQYYALSLARIVALDIDLSDTSYQDVAQFWGDLTLDLVKRLARNFHSDDKAVFLLLKNATPSFINELIALAKDNHSTPQELINNHFFASRSHLPTWSDKFITGAVLRHLLSDPNADAHTDEPDATLTDMTDDADHDALVSDEDELHDVNKTKDDAEDQSIYQTKPKPSSKPLIIGLCVAGLTLAIGGGTWFYLNKKTDDTPIISEHEQALYTGTLNPPKLSLTTGENGTLYACKADVGSSDLQHSLVNTLQQTFGQVNCIMDIDDSFGASLTGLERLASIITMIKSEPFTSVEIIGNTIYINNPKTDVVGRLVGDIALLAPQFKVLATPPLDITKTVADSIAEADKARLALSSPPNIYALSRAMSMQIIDFNYDSNIPTSNQELLAHFAKIIGENPATKLIIAVHTDTNNPDESANITLSQSQADALKNFLVQHGAKPEQLIAKGVGSTFPVADNVTMIGKFKNRRSEFLVYDEAVMSALSNIAMPKQPIVPTQVDPSQMVQSAPYVPSGEYLEAQQPQQPTYQAPMPAAPNGMVQGMPDGVVNPQAPQPVQPQYNAQQYAQPAIQSAPPQNYTSDDRPAEHTQSEYSISDAQGHNLSNQTPPADTSSGIDPKLLNPVGTEIGKGRSNEVR